MIVVGASGSGKTTAAARIGERLALPHTEIDALHHGPGWTPRPEFLDDVRALVASERWVTEWQYDAARPILTERADLAVWLDLPRATVMRQVVKRTLRRRIRREELWNGNREGPLSGIFTDSEHIIRWAWSTHASRAALVEVAAARHPALEVVRLRHPRDADRWLARTFS